MEEPKYFVKKMSNQNQASDQNQPKSSGSNVAIIIVIIVLVGFVFLAVLGVGGYFAWKYFSKKPATKTETPAVSSTVPSTTQNVTSGTAPAPIPANTTPATPQGGATQPQVQTQPQTQPQNYPAENYDPGTEYYDYTWQSEYVIPGSDSYVISESELWNFTPWQLKVARNEIYARHGRKFVHKDMACYFARQSWYYINPNFSESDLSNVENKNVATILGYEERIGSPLLRKDSGCHD